MEIREYYIFTDNKRWVFGSLFLALILLSPIIVLAISFFSGSKTTLLYLLDNVLLDYTLNTIYLIIITSFFALILGVFPAWIISNYIFFGRKFFDIVLYLPLAIPSYIMGFTYIDILSYTGPIQSYLRDMSPYLAEIFNKDYLQIEVLGALLGLALYPYVYTASRISFSLIGSNYVNISKNLGLSTFQTFYKVILPLSRPAIFSGLFLVIMEVLNEYGAVKYFGVNTYTTGIFRSWFSFGDVSGAIQLACILLVIVLFFFILDRFSIKNSKFYYQKNSQIQKMKLTNWKKSVFMSSVCFIPFFFGFLVPFFFILNNAIQTYSLTNFEKLIQLTGNTVYVASVASVIIIFVALFFLFVERISKAKINFFTNNLISLGYALPGAIIGLGIILLFSKFSLVGSLFILIFAYIIRFLAVAKSPIKSSLDKHPNTIDDTGRNLGLNPLNLLRRLHLPINKFALISAFIVTFIDIMKELPITLILRPFNFDTLATQTYEFAVEEMIPLSATYSLVIITLGSLMLLILKNFIDKQINVS